MAVKRAFLAVLRYALSLLLLIVIWQCVVRLFAIPAYLLPTPGRVVETLWVERALFWAAARYTLSNMLMGGGLGVILGVLVGVAVSYSRVLRWLVEPYLVIFQSFPRESLFPLLIVWLGFGFLTKVVNAALLSFFPIAVITLNGLLDVRQEYVALIRGWGASRWQEFMYCRLPALVPTLVSGAKVALPLALIGAVLGEFMGGNEGLGYIIITSGSAFRIDRTFGALVVLSLSGLTVLAVIQVIQKKFLMRFNQE